MLIKIVEAVELNNIKQLTELLEGQRVKVKELSELLQVKWIYYTISLRLYVNRSWGCRRVYKWTVGY